MGHRRRGVIWSEGARLELERAVADIAREHPLAASGVLSRVLEAARSLGTLAERGRTVPERDDPAVRELLVDPFRLIYRVRPWEVHVLACIHQRRNLRRWKGTDRLREGVRSEGHLREAGLAKARREGEVRIKRRDGAEFAVRSVLAGGLPLNVPRVDTDVSREDILQAIQESRERDPGGGSQ